MTDHRATTTDESDELDSQPVPASHEAALRSCLRCGTSFQSEWAGERICTRCKGTTAWRQGVPARPHPMR